MKHKTLGEFLISIESSSESWRNIKCVLTTSAGRYTGNVGEKMCEIMTLGMQYHMGIQKISTCMNGVNTIEVDIGGYGLFYHAIDKETRKRTQRNWGNQLDFMVKMFENYDAQLIVMDKYDGKYVTFDKKLNIVTMGDCPDGEA